MEKIQTTLVIFLKLFIVFSHIIIYTEFAMSGLELRLVGGSEIRFRTKTGSRIRDQLRNMTGWRIRDQLRNKTGWRIRDQV